MYLLSIESSAKTLSIAVSFDGKLLKSRTLKAEQKLETALLKGVERLLSSAAVSFKSIGVVAVGLGPGSFTSLRVGLATVKAFTLAADKKLIGVCSLDVIANASLTSAQNADADEICVLVDARRAKVYAAIYDLKGKLKTAHLLSALDDVLKQVKGRTFFTGDALSVYQKQIVQAYDACAVDGCKAVFAKEKDWYPKAQVLAELAGERVRLKKYDEAARLSPIYLYAEDCQVRTAGNLT